ncbi:MAG TPA: AAA family ATPase, partial [Polyangiaceae bacterium]|nr:AAA family ATPase [Polyangiaceae bacterium]
MAAEEIIDFRGERSRHRYFVGREDVLAEIDRALFEGSIDGRWVLVTGNPGMGKSALLSACVERVKARVGGEPPHHFLRRGQHDWDRPDAVVRSLAARIEALFPEQMWEDTQPELRLSKRLAEVSEKVLVPQGQRLVLVVDGLDEVQGSEGTVNPLPLFLPASLPRGVVVLCASRPVYPHLAWIESQGNVHPIDLGEERWSSSNEEACRQLLRVRAAELKPTLEAGFVEAAATRAEGNLLYADRLVEWLRSQPVERRRVELLPRGIEAFLTQVWERLRALPKDEFEQGARGLGVLCAAREALPLSALGASAGWPMSDLDARDRFLRATRTLLLKEEAPPGGDGEAAYRPYHESFRAFVVQRLGAEVMRGYHARLFDTVAAWPARASAGAFEQRYALRHALGHAVSARAWDKARELAMDVGFLEAACEVERTLMGHTGEVNACAITPDGRRIVSASDDTTLKVWDLDSGRLLRSLEGHSRHVTACAITPDGRRIVSASWDKTLEVWDLDSGRLERSLEGHSDSVTACAITPDGRRIVSA